MRTSNHLIGLLNFLTFLLSIPILGGGIWLSTRANNTDCMRFLQWPLIVIGVAIMVVSLAGFAGACYRNTFLMYLYLWAMFFIIVVLIGFVIFAYVVTDKGSGRPVLNRGYEDYYLPDYSGWLKDRVASDEYWRKISSCIRDSGVCRKMGRVDGGYSESADVYYQRKLNPIEMNNHPFLQFDNRKRKEQKCNERLALLWERRDQFGQPRRLNWDVMEDLNQSERLDEMLSWPMSRLLRISQPIYLEPTLEFFASYDYDKPTANVADPESLKKRKRITFRLGRKWHKWSVARLGVELGIYANEELNDDVFSNVHKFDDLQDKINFWASVAQGPPYEARSAKASRLRDPLLRVLHHVFSHTICGRMDSLGNCPTPDLLFLYSIVTGTHINLAARMAEYFVNSAGRTGSSQIHGGEYVTVLGLATGVFTEDTIPTFTFVTEGIDVDLRSLRAMGIIVDTAAGPRLRGLEGEIWDPTPEQPEDADMPDQHEQPHQQPDQHQPQHQYPYQDWPRDLPTYPEFYHQFQELQVNQQELQRTQQTSREEMHAGFAYIFGGLERAHPGYFSDPPCFPFDAPAGHQGARRYDDSGPSGTHHDDDEDDDNED